MPPSSSKRYQAMLPPPELAPGVAINDLTPASSRARSKIWNSSIKPSNGGSKVNCDAPIQLFLVGPRSTGARVIWVFSATTTPLTNRRATFAAWVTAMWLHSFNGTGSGACSSCFVPSTLMT